MVVFLQGGGRGRTLFEAGREVVRVEEVAAVDVWCGPRVAFKGVLDGDFAAILLPEERADYRAALLPECVACDVVGDGEEDERVQYGLELRALLARYERVGHAVAPQ